MFKIKNLFTTNVYYQINGGECDTLFLKEAIREPLHITVSVFNAIFSVNDYSYMVYSIMAS